MSSVQNNVFVNSSSSTSSSGTSTSSTSSTTITLDTRNAEDIAQAVVLSLGTASQSLQDFLAIIDADVNAVTTASSASVDSSDEAPTVTQLFDPAQLQTAIGSVVNNVTTLQTELLSLTHLSVSLTDDIKTWAAGIQSALADFQSAAAQLASADGTTALPANAVQNAVTAANNMFDAVSGLWNSSPGSTTDDSILGRVLVETTPNILPPAPEDKQPLFNAIIVCLALIQSVASTITIIMQLKSLVNDMIKERQQEVQDFLSVLTTISSAYTSAQAEAAKLGFTSESTIINWTGNIGGNTFADLLNKSNTDFKETWDVISSTDTSAIALCLWDPTKNADAPCTNALINRFARTPLINGKSYLDLNGLKNMLAYFGQSQATFVGDNISQQNPSAFDNSSNLSGLVKSVSSTIVDNLQSLLTSNVSKLNLLEQQLNQQFNNLSSVLANISSNIKSLTG